MALRPILRFPHPGLRQRAEPATEFGEDLRSLAQDLLETMRAAPGVGITAPHVGIPLRLVVLELEPGTPRFFVNPEILEVSEEKIRHAEGSVSMLGATEEVERPARIRLRYQDLEGAAHEEAAEGFAAVCHQQRSISSMGSSGFSASPNCGATGSSRNMRSFTGRFSAKSMTRRARRG